MTSKRPKTQKQIGGAIISTDDWEKSKGDVMADICEKKFHQNPELMKFLLETGTTFLCEDNPNCDWWGLGVGRNHPSAVNAKTMPGNRMGHILMKIRNDHAATLDQ